jgi:hypothetical protein
MPDDDPREVHEARGALSFREVRGQVRQFCEVEGMNEKTPLLEMLELAEAELRRVDAKE